MSSSELRLPLFGVVALSGVAALCHELLWTRRLVDVLGSSATANARVLGAFFLGLSLGAALASRAVDRSERPWRALALAEAAIALLSMPALTLPSWSRVVWQAVGVEGLVAPAGAMVKLLISLAVVAPPAIAMGFTLPLALAASKAQPTDIGRVGSALYAVNTTGAVLGVVAVGGWALASLGLTASMWLATGLNLTAALVAAAVDRTAAGAPANVAAPRAEARSPLSMRTLGTAFLSGAGVLAIEVIALHILMLVATMSFHAPAAILATVIAMLALAAGVTSIAIRRVHAERAITVALATGGVLTVLAPLVYWALVRGGALAESPSSVLSFVVALFGLTALFIGPAALCVGAVFPLLMDVAERERGSGPSAVARLLAVNGVGGWVGAELAHQGLLPALGPHVALGAVGCAYGLAAVAFAFSSPAAAAPRRRSSAYALLCATGALAVSWFGLPQLPTLNPHLGFLVLAERSDRHGTLAVVDHAHMGRALVLNNQYVLGSTAAQADQERQTHLPLLLHPKPERVALIGLATGTSAGASLAHAPVKQVEVLELSRAVIDAAQKHFGDANRNVVGDPRVRVLEEDGRTYIGAARERFDVIVGDLFLPWSSGAGRLYSVEHFEGVRQALAAGGVFCQWLPMYQLTEEQLELIEASLLRVFPTVHLFRTGFHPDKPVLGLVAFKDAELSWAAVSNRATAEREHGELDDPSTRHGVAIAQLYLGRLAAGSRATAVNTLGNLALELDASRTRLSRHAHRQYMYGQRWNELLQQRLAAVRADEALSADLRRLVQLGVTLTTWEIALRVKHAQVDTLAERIRHSFPLVVNEDRGANWSKWPGLLRWRGPTASSESLPASHALSTVDTDVPP